MPSMAAAVRMIMPASKPINGSEMTVTAKVTLEASADEGVASVKAMRKFPGNVKNAPSTNKTPATEAGGISLISFGSIPVARTTAMITIRITADVTGWGAAAEAEITTEIGEPPNREESASARPE